ncbi:MAG: LptF/LptG family permease [Maricaulaceae bacterium]|nr:LptF/LptG family permease [Maricaulaceae bacterium]
MKAPGILSRYMAVQSLYGLAAAFVVIGSVIVLIDFVEQSRGVAVRAEVTAMDLLSLTFLKAPLLIEQTLPFVFLFGVLSTLFRLNRRSELVVMRASGVSAWRIIVPSLVIALIAGVLGATLLNPFGARMNTQFEQRRDSLIDARRQPGEAQQLWLRETRPDGFNVIYARAADADAGLLQGVTIYTFTRSQSGAPHFDGRIDAPAAQLASGFWILTDAVERIPGLPPSTLGEVSAPTGITRQALFERSASPAGVSFWELPGLIESAAAAGLDARRYELRWHGLLALPLTLIAATLIAAAASLRLFRLGGAAAFALAGGAAGFLMFFLQEVLRSLGATGALDPATAAWSAPALTALLALVYIATTEDG